MLLETVKACIARAEDTGYRLALYYQGAQDELHRFVVAPLKQAIAEREIDPDRWDTVMLRLKWYENHYAELQIKRGRRL